MSPVEMFGRSSVGAWIELPRRASLRSAPRLAAHRNPVKRGPVLLRQYVERIWNGEKTTRQTLSSGIPVTIPEIEVPAWPTKDTTDVSPGGAIYKCRPRRHPEILARQV